MTPQLLFIIGVVLLLAATLVLLLLPFRRRTAGAEISRRQLNAAIYRDEFAELERDLAEGSLSQADYEQARAELQRRLLEDSDAALAAVAEAPLGRKLPVALLLALPVAAALLYLTLGNPAAINPPQERRFTADQIEEMVAGLAAKLEKEPDNQQGWVMLARSYKAMGRLPEAAKAYERAGSMLEDNANLLLDYADTQASVDGFTNKVRKLIDKALKLEPNHPMGLWLRGTAAYEDKQYGKALADWERLLALLEPGSEDAKILSANIEDARQKAGLPIASKKSGSASTAQANASRANVQGRVELAAGIAGQLPAGAMVMVIARPADGSRMPAAVWRAPAKDFPATFVLDDSLSMSPDRKLSNFPEVVVEAWVSRTGQAIPQPGDLFGPPQTIKLGARGIRLIVDQVRK